MNELRLLIPSPSEFQSRDDKDSSASAGSGSGKDSVLADESDEAEMEHTHEAADRACGGGLGRGSKRAYGSDPYMVGGPNSRWRWINPPQRSLLPGGELGRQRAYHTCTYVPAGVGSCASARLIVFGGFADDSPLDGLEVAQVAPGRADGCRNGEGGDEEGAELPWEWSQMVCS